ncbi:MAG: heme lyase CcmF/NrfE family subunit, partial [Acidimicrobiales bacterium]
MNAALGRAGVVLAFVSALAGVVSLAVALSTGRRHLLRQASTFVAFVAGGAVLAFAAMERGLITRDFSMEYVAAQGSTKTPALF